MTDEAPLDADELMNLADRIDRLPPDDVEWVNRLFAECLRARMREAELLVGQTDEAQSTGSDIEAQLAQVALDTAEWLKTLWNVGYMGAGNFPAQPRSAFPLIELEDVLKSSLFARIREGKRPLPFPPPTRRGSPWHELIEDIAASYHVDAEILRGEDSRVAGVLVEGDGCWQIVETVSECEYLVQHRGQGPIFRLQVDDFDARLTREPPHSTRRIRLQERGGFRSFTLEWPKDGTQIQDIPLRATTWERAESEAGHWIAANHPQMYGQVSFERIDQTL